MTMTGVHDPFLVVLSLVIATLASFTALGFAARARSTTGRVQRLWLGAAAIALGSGIWSMHFVAMLAFSMPHIAMTYALGPTLLSLAIAVGFTAAGFAVYNWERQSWDRTLAAGLLIGSGVAVMHFVGMAAMRMPATIRYDPLWVVTSVVIALLAATVAVRLAAQDHGLGARAAAAVVMGIAISGMHFTGMHAATFAHVAGNFADDPAAVSQKALAVSVGFVTLAIMLLGLAVLRIEKLFDRGAQREARLRFLGAVNDTLFQSSDARGAMAAATRLLGERVHASRCAYADVAADEDGFRIVGDYTAPGIPTSVGQHRLSVFGHRTTQKMRAGGTLVVRDVRRETQPGEGLEAFEAIGVRAIICCPLISDGKLAAMMAVHQAKPRDWTLDEVELVRDVVERCWAHVKRVGAEEKLRESEERLRLAVDNAEIGFWDVDVVHDALIWPARTKAMFGISAERPVSLQDFYDGLHPDDLDATAAAFAAAMDPQARALYDVEYRTIGKEDDVVRWLAARGRGVFNAQGECIRVTGTVVDVTARKRAEEALRELNATLEARIAEAIKEREDVQEALRQSQKLESMGQLTGGVAHDFNNLLTPIIGSLDLIQRKKLGGEREQRLIDGAIQSADRARTLVQRLLAFARRQPLQPVPVDMGALVQGMAELLGSTVGPKIKLAIDVPPSVPAARADQNQLEMAILNLAVNARDAMEHGGTLTLKLQPRAVGGSEVAQLPAGNYLLLTVADTGCGMDSETLARATEPFFSTKGLGKGTGLGLSMVHGLASQLGGALTIDSQPGDGTSVKLWLPASEAVAAVVDAATAEQGGFVGGGTALVVDDEALVRASTADMMTELGYRVVEAESGEAALKAIEQDGGFDIIVTDHLMPGQSGTELAHAVRALGKTIPVLIVSGYADSAAIDPELPRLAKPFRRDELAACVRELTGAA